MAKKAKGPAGPAAVKASKPERPKRRKPPLVDRLTTLVLVLFLAALAVPALAPA